MEKMWKLFFGGIVFFSFEFVSYAIEVCDDCVPIPVDHYVINYYPLYFYFVFLFFIPFVLIILIIIFLVKTKKAMKKRINK